MNRNSQAILDELLVLKCRRGDSAAWRELVERYQPRLFYFIRRLVDEERDAWDVLQQTWLTALKGLRDLREPRALRTWLYRIARNQAALRLRQAGREAMRVNDEVLNELPEEEPETDDEPWPPDAAGRLHVCLGELSLPHREVLTLHFLEDLSVEEVAAITGAAPGTVKSRLYYAKRALREALEDRVQP